MTIFKHPHLAKRSEEDPSTKDCKAELSGAKRKFVSLLQFDNSQMTVADMRSDMTFFTWLSKDSIALAKHVCIEDPDQPALNTVLTEPNKENQFLT